MRRLTWALVPLCLAFGTANASAYTPDDTEAAIEQVSASYGVPFGRLHSIVSCETGRTMDPSVVGDHGQSLGAVQLNRHGLLPLFYSVGYTDPYSPYQAVEFLARALIGEWSSLAVGSWSWTCA